LLDESFYNLSNNKNINTYKNFANSCVNETLRRRHNPDVEEILKNLKKEGNLRLLNPFQNIENVATVINQFSAWHIVHSLSFGPLYLLFSILKGQIAESIAKDFDITVGPLRSIFNSLSRLRNACAHHEPIWFYRVQEQVRFPERHQGILYPEGLDLEGALKRQGIYILCAAVHLLLSYISETTTWYARLKPIISRFDPPARNYMGFPKDWDELQFWRNSDVRTVPQILQ